MKQSDHDDRDSAADRMQGRTESSSATSESSHAAPVPAGLAPSKAPADSASRLETESATSLTSPVSATEARRQRREQHRVNQREKIARQNPKTDSGGIYIFFATAALMFGLWFVGPRLVEEYQYAAATGKNRADYEHATQTLASDPLASVSYAYQMVARKVQPSVVSVTAPKQTERTNRSPRGGMGRAGLGSGVIMSDDGYILTNAHVLEGAVRYLVELHDRRRFTAELVGLDKVSDLALLKIDCQDLIAAEWGDSDELDVGSIVWAFGNPYELQQTVTSGIISGKDRPGDINRKQTMLQTDAAINPGNSGGPLADSHGRVIGINTSIYGTSFRGIGFAVPSTTASYVYEQLRANGSVTRGFLGATPVEVSNYDVKRLNLPDLLGAKLVNVVSGSPAAIAGIEPRDVIRSWNGVPIHEYKTLYRLAEMTKPDSTVEVTLMRNGEEFRTLVTVGDRAKMLVASP